ncbi:MAG: VWA domain-containing protein, partial [Acidobacteriota bacterium]|nr:VWA domain-containing protein [Acidobacteriota bacterium]
TMEALVAATGGYMATDRSGLDDVLIGLRRRFEVRVRDAAATFSPRPLQVEYAEGYGAGLRPPRIRQWISAGTPEVLSEIRARRLLIDGIEEGPLMVTAQAFRRAGTEKIAVEIEPLDAVPTPDGPRSLRLTIGELGDGDRGIFHHSIISVGSEVREMEGGGLAVETDLPTVATSLSPIVVVVEDLTSGRWGGTYATVLESSDDGSLSGWLVPSPRVIHLLEPVDELAVGSTLFETIHDVDVARVEFYLDGRLEANVGSAPFSARLDLGRLPEPHRVEVVAFDVAGRELGRDRLSINESGGVLRVRIVRPRVEPGRTSELTGRVDVDVEIESPRSVPVARVEFFWNDDLVATRFAPPYRQTVVVPEEAPRGFFRVVAHLTDGESAEDVVFVNSPGGSERVKVELIQLFTVVTDREGHPIQGLSGDRFEVLEDGVSQEIATFTEAKDLPLTIGLAVDSSASMFVKLPRVQKAVATFLGGLDSAKDRAFLVDFGTEPQLHHDTSRDLAAVERALFNLVPDGRTAIWKGIAFSLVQLQGIPGKKALIVFSDGADEDPDFSFRTCLKFARRVGVPVYIVVSNDEIFRTGGRGLSVRGFINRLESLTRAVGGRVFFSRVGEDLESIYSQIDDELRSQYVLGFYARGEGENRWRSVRVDVDEAGARARTVAGYFR